MKQSAALLTTALLLAVAFYLSRTVRNPSSVAASPEACLKRMFQAAEQGEVDAYLNCFTGQQRQRLERELGNQGASAFAASLKSALDKLKGRALSGSSKVADDDRARMTVERIYERHAERQDYHFVRDSAGWRIESVGQVQEFQPPIPYGTPVYERDEAPGKGGGP